MIGFLFAGQGSQTEGMGIDLYENVAEFKPIFDGLDSKLKEVLLTKSSLINETQYAQPSIYLISLLLAKEVSKTLKPKYVAGLSLGEYSALAFSDVFSFNDGLEITKNRGLIMMKALENIESGMYAVLGATKEVVEEVVSKVEGVYIANYNCPGQIVISGYLKSLEEAVLKLKDLGVRKCIKLNVTGAFHTPLLEDASVKLGNFLTNYEFKKATNDVVFNTTGTVCLENVKDLLVKQIKSSVMFEQSIEYMIENGVDTFFEIGSNGSIANFVKKINKDVKVFSIYDYNSLISLGGYNESSNSNG